MDKARNFVMKDWLRPMMAGIVVWALSSVFLIGSSIGELQKLYAKSLDVGFVYATTMFGLIVSAYAILQGFTSIYAKQMKRWFFYGRLKWILEATLFALMVFGMACLVLDSTNECRIPRQLLIVSIGFLHGLIAFTMDSVFQWIKIIIRYFDRPDNEKET